MYCLTDQQIEYILDDIRRNGIEMEELQSNLLDHICCILERDLKEGDDFESHYRRVVRQFYTHSLREIEEETIHLLINKNYYTMKKIMLTSGFISVAAFTGGSFLKIMHWSGASTMLILAMTLLTAVFLPLVAISKIQESKTLSEKIVFATGVLVAILYVVSTLFAIQHWEGRTALWISTTAASMFVFLPAYLYNGMQRSDKLNTMIVAIILVGFTGSLFTMIRLY